MSYKEILDSIAKGIEHIIVEETDESLEIPTQDYGWNNKRFISEVFRIAHIERYSEKTLDVLHVTCFPNVVCGAPIFGFDVITTDKKPLAAFLDWSPIYNDIQYQPIHEFVGIDYPLPEWAKLIFSNKAIAIVPRDISDMQKLEEIALHSFREYMNLLNNCNPDYDKVQDIADKQNYYCEQQQKNERTFNVLKAKLGEAKAREFMNTILFPKIILH